MRFDRFGPLRRLRGGLGIAAAVLEQRPQPEPRGISPVGADVDLGGRTRVCESSLGEQGTDRLQAAIAVGTGRPTGL